ncbi:hypothetical protein A2U01_0076126, partial [Trifolium medium]|nr:hypothetical protein [Trifolium medium]
YAHFIRKEFVLMVVAVGMIMSKLLDHRPLLHLLQ